MSVVLSRGFSGGALTLAFGTSMFFMIATIPCYVSISVSAAIALIVFVFILTVLVFRVLPALIPFMVPMQSARIFELFLIGLGVSYFFNNC